MTRSLTKTLLAAVALVSGPALAQAEIVAPAVKVDLSKPDPVSELWKSAPEATVALLAQPMVVPRPATLTTTEVKVQALHDSKHIAFRLRWKDPDRSEAGRLGQFSDGAALEFPVGDSEVPPPVMMGAPGAPVHLFHWRAQYQRDREVGKPQPKDLYPNGTFDMYPLEFRDHGNLGRLDPRIREQYSPAKAEGNPQSFPKNGVDELVAEGFSTSSVQQGHQSAAQGVWANGEWNLVIVRKLRIEGGSNLKVGKKSHVAFAIWQGQETEVGSRKSLTMLWSPLSVNP